MTRSPGRRDMRKFDRKVAELPVTVRASGNQIEGGIRLESADVSEGGAFLRSEMLFEIGAVLLLEIPLPSGQIVKATGRVVRVARQRGREAVPGMGIEFTRLALQDRRAIASSLAELGRSPTT